MERTSAMNQVEYGELQHNHKHSVPLIFFDFASLFFLTLI
jgi:hypothetical protein